MTRPIMFVAAPVAVLALLAPTASYTATAPDQQEAAVTSKPPVAFDESFLTDPEAIAAGQEVWEARCKFCHGRAAYPGKAPRLKPSRYQPEFVYERVTNGFRGMPSFVHEFDEAERRAVVAYVLSREFSP